MQSISVIINFYTFLKKKNLDIIGGKKFYLLNKPYSRSFIMWESLLLDQPKYIIYIVITACFIYLETNLIDVKLQRTSSHQVVVWIQLPLVKVVPQPIRALNSLDVLWHSVSKSMKLAVLMI